MFSRRTLDSVYLALLPAAFIGYLLKVLRLKGCTTDDINGDIIWLRPPEEWCASVPDGPRSLLALARTFLLPSLLWPIAASELHFLVSIYTVLLGLLLLVTCTPRGRYTLDNPYRVALALVRLVRPSTPWPLAISHTLHFEGFISAAFAFMLPLPPRAQAATALLDLAQVAAICYLYGDAWPYGMHRVPFVLMQAACTVLIIGTTYYVWAGHPRPQPAPPEPGSLLLRHGSKGSSKAEGGEPMAAGAERTPTATTDTNGCCSTAEPARVGLARAYGNGAGRDVDVGGGGAGCVSGVAYVGVGSAVVAAGGAEAMASAASRPSICKCTDAGLSCCCAASMSSRGLGGPAEAAAGGGAGAAQSGLGAGSASAALKAVLEAIPEGHAWGNCDCGCGGVRLVKAAVAGAGAAAGTELQGPGYGLPTGLSLIYRRARRARMAGLYGGVAGDAVHVCVKLPGVNPEDLLPCWRQRVATAVAQRGGDCSIGASTATDTENWGYGVTTACMRSGCIELHLDLVGTAAAFGPAGAQADGAPRTDGAGQPGAPMVAQWQQQHSLQQQPDSATAAGPDGSQGTSGVLAGCEPAPVEQQGLATSILEALGLPQGYDKQVKAQVGAHLLTLAPAAPVRGSQSAAWAVLGSRRMQALDVPWVSHVQPPAIVTAVPCSGCTCAAAVEAADTGAEGARGGGGEQEVSEVQGSAFACPPGHVAVQLCITVYGAMERLQHAHQDPELELLALFGGSFLRVLDVVWRPMGQPSGGAAANTTVPPLPYSNGRIGDVDGAGGSGASGVGRSAAHAGGVGLGGTCGGQAPGLGVLGQAGSVQDGQVPGLRAVRLPPCLSLARRQALVRVAVPVGRTGPVNLVVMRRGTAGQGHTLLLLQPAEAEVAAEVAALQRRALAAEGLEGEVAAAEAALAEAGATVLGGMCERSNTPAALPGLPLSNVVTFMGDLGRWLQYRDYWGRQARGVEEREQEARVDEELQQGRRAQGQQLLGQGKEQEKGLWAGAMRWRGFGAAWIAQRVGGRTAAARGCCSGCCSTGCGHGPRELAAAAPSGAGAGDASPCAGDDHGGGNGAAAIDVPAGGQRPVGEVDTSCLPEDHPHPHPHPHPHDHNNHRSRHSNRRNGFAYGRSGAREEDTDTELKLLRGSLPCLTQPEYQAHMASVQRLVLEFALEHGMSSVAAEALKCVPLPVPAPAAAAAPLPAAAAAGVLPIGLNLPMLRTEPQDAEGGPKAEPEPRHQHLREPQEQQQQLLQAHACCLLSMAELSRAMSPDGLSLLHRAVRSGHPHTVDVVVAAAAAAARAAAAAAAAEVTSAAAPPPCAGTAGLGGPDGEEAETPPVACRCAAARAGAAAAMVAAARNAGTEREEAEAAAEAALLRCAGVWDSVDHHGITPLHYAAVLEDGGVLARHLVRRHAGAAAQWARGGPVPGVPSAAAFAAESGLQVDVGALRAEGDAEEREQREREGREEQEKMKRKRREEQERGGVRAREAGGRLGGSADGGQRGERKEEEEGVMEQLLAGGAGVLCTLWRKASVSAGVHRVQGCRAHSCGPGGFGHCGGGGGYGRGGGGGYGCGGGGGGGGGGGYGGGGGGGRSKLTFFTLQGLTCAAGVAQAFSSHNTAHHCELLLLAAVALAAAAALVALWLAAPAVPPPLLALARAAVDSTGTKARESAATSAGDAGKQTRMPGLTAPAAAVTAVTAAAAAVVIAQPGVRHGGGDGGGGGAVRAAPPQWALPPPPPVLQLHGWQLACGLQALAAAVVVVQAAGLGARGGLGSTPAVGSLPWRG